MILRRLTLAALFGLPCLAGPARADEPGRLGLPAAIPIPAVAADTPQKLADAVASALRQAGTLKDYKVDIAVGAGVVELTGTVADQSQREEVLRLAQGVPGVGRVRDRLSVAGAVVPVSRRQDAEEKGPAPLKDGPGPLPPPTNTNPKAGPDNGRNGPSEGGMPEPKPLFSANAGNYSGLNPPSFPPHAWPTYAPYNNFSRVGCPTAYPYNSFPFIGPLYPYPKVPLGWRSVKLEWDDGYWWFSRVGNKYDWWKLRYW